MNKEAIIVILDVSPTMKKKLSAVGDASQTRFQMALESVKMLVEQKLLYAGGHELGMILFGTSETQNNLNEQMGEGQYENVLNFRQIDKIDLEFFRNLETIEPEEKAQKHGDLMDALIVGMDMLIKHTGKRKYRRRIFLITDGEKEAKFDDKELKTIIANMNESDTRLNVITLDFCNDLEDDEDEEDDDEEEEEEDKNDKKMKVEKINPNESKAQLKNRQLLEKITDKVKGAIYPAKVAMQIYQQFKKKEVSARTKYRGNLDIAKNLKLSVSIFTRTKEENFPSLKKHSLVAQESKSANEGKVQLDRQYAEVDDPDQNPIPGESQIKAFNYGKQLVPVAKENEEILKYKQKKKDGEESQVDDEDIKMEGGDGVERQFKMLGFADQSQVPRHHFMNGVDVVLPVKGAKNERAFAALVYAMIETHRVIIAKIIERKNADPKLVVLYPHISKKKPLLYMVQLPTAEDIRDYQFPSLTQSNPKQRQAASKLIQSLDLSKAIQEDEEVEERLKPELTFNPALQYFGQVVTNRIIHPEQQELPQLNENISNYVRPDVSLFQRSAEEVSAFEEAFQLEYRNEDENRKKKRIYWRDLIQREEAKNAEEAKQVEEEQNIARMKLEQKGDGFEFKDQEVKEISSVNPIQDFNKMMSDRNVDRVGEAIKQMQDLVERFVKNSLKGDLYQKALECLQALREGCINEDEGEAFNKFMERIKKLFSSGQNSDFFQELIKKGLTLITNDESKTSSRVTKKEAQEFLKVQEEQIKKSGASKKKKQEDDLMDEIE